MQKFTHPLACLNEELENNATENQHTENWSKINLLTEILVQCIRKTHGEWGDDDFQMFVMADLMM